MTIRAAGVQGHRIARNALLNFVGQGVLLLLGVWALPLIALALGAARFGVLMLALAILTYLTLFDLGLGRAVVKFVAEALSSEHQSRIARITWSAVLLLFLFGTIGGIGLAVFARVFAHRAFVIPSDLLEETRRALLVTAAAVPFITASSGLQGLLHAVQRFGLLNAVRVGGGASKFLMLVVMARMGSRLPEIALGLLVLEIAEAAVYLMIGLVVVPALRHVAVDQQAILAPMRYGSWLSVSAGVGMTIVYLDRFVIAAMLPIGNLTYYAIPAEIINRLWIAVTSVTTALFPVLSAGSAKRAVDLYAHATRLTLLAIIPVATILTVFGDDLLRLWLGSAFAAKGGRALQLLAIGFAVGAAGRIAHNYVLALGYPGAVAKFHLFELPLYGLLAVVLTGVLQITGMALAWTLRTVAETVFVLVVLNAKHPPAFSALTNLGLGRVFAAGGIFLLIAWAVKLMGITPLPAILAVSGCTAVFAFGVWQRVLYPAERAALLAAVHFWRRPAG